MIYDVDYFINKFKAIPEFLWITGTIGNVGGPRCANGHCMGSNHGDYTDESAALHNVFSAIVVHDDNGESTWKWDTEPGYSYTADRINNGQTLKYRQPTPKQRILAALSDIKKMLSKEQEVQASVATKTSKETEAGTKIIHHYHKVTVPSSIEKQTKELILS